ncbi:MAG: heavy-metal-associated domain-containing protein [Sellimonas intestinalis]
MTDVIILMILIILIGAAVSLYCKGKEKRNQVHRLSCGRNCPSSRKIPKKKLSGPVVERRTIHISGMECQHCVSSVMEALNAVDGVTARVNLSKGNAKVSCDRVVSEDELRCAIERAGFQVISIS